MPGGGVPLRANVLRSGCFGFSDMQSGSARIVVRAFVPAIRIYTDDEGKVAYMYPGNEQDCASQEKPMEENMR